MQRGLRRRRLCAFASAEGAKLLGRDPGSSPLVLKYVIAGGRECAAYVQFRKYVPEVRSRVLSPSTTQIKEKI